MIWDMSGHYAARRAHAQSNASEYARNTAENIDRACVGAQASRLRECIAEQIAASREHQRGEQDLRAQQDMADWAFWMMLFGGVTMGLTAWALWFVKGTLEATRQAVKDTSQATEAMRKANEISERLGTAQTRAYLSAKPKSASYRNEIIEFVIEITNSGQSPARQAQAVITAYLKTGKDERKTLTSSVKPLADISVGETIPVTLRVEGDRALADLLNEEWATFDVEPELTYQTVFSTNVETESVKYLAFVGGDREPMISAQVTPGTRIPLVKMKMSLHGSRKKKPNKGPSPLT